MKVIFGTRGSDLALAQTRHVMGRFLAANPDVQAELTIIKTTGDRLADAPLSEIGGFGAFTREIEMALLNGDIDVAVHSLKDLPVQQPEGLCVAVIAERQTPVDVLVSNEGYTLDSLPEKARVGTSSLRRKMQLLRVRPDLEIAEIRGNVPTRLAKMRAGNYDGIIMALAGMVRLGLHEEAGIREIPPEQMLPAPGQGALALEIRRDREDIAERLLLLRDRRAEAETRCERTILEAFGGGCRSPLGTFARYDGEHLQVEAIAGDETLCKFARAQRTGTLAEAEEMGRAIGVELRRALGL